MVVQHYTEITAEPVAMAGADKVTIRWLLGKDSPAPHFWLRYFEVQPGGHSPCHTHPFEHEIFVLEGNGSLNAQGGRHPLRAGSFALVEPNEEHQFENTGSGVLKFLCLVPKE